MKKKFFFIGLLSLLCLVTSCYDDSELRERLDNLEVVTVASINQQLASLQSSVNVLVETDASLKATIELLKTSDQVQQVQIDSLINKEQELAADITSLQQAIASLQSWVDTRLQGYTDEMSGQLRVIQDSITAVAERTNVQFASIQAQLNAISEQIARLFHTLDILFDIAEEITYTPGSQVVVNYTLVNGDDKTTVECITEPGWEAVVAATSADAGTITVTTPTEGGEGKVIVFVGNSTSTIMRFLFFVEGQQSDENRYTFIGTWPQSATTPGGALCGGELSKVLSKTSGRTYSAESHMGSAFLQDHRATADEMAWLADYTAKPSKMDGFSKWSARRVTLYPYEKPLPADCNQHSIGDCNTVSTLATMAYLYPRFIQSIITQVSDRQFQVKMFDPDGNRIIVGVDNQVLCTNDSYIAQMTGKSNRITWATILEKAIMKWLYIFRPGNELGGFGAEGMTPLFTGDGRSFAVSPGKCTAEELKLFVTVSLQHGLIVNGGFNKGGLKMGGHETVTAHGHSFFMANDPNALFAIRNPWGQGSDDHVMQCYDADHAPSGYDGSIPSTIDLRIISPGIASLYYDGPAQPYEIPTF